MANHFKKLLYLSNSLTYGQHATLPILPSKTGNIMKH